VSEQMAFTFDERHDRLFGDVSAELLSLFKAFHLANPKVYELFCKYAREAKAAGRERFSHWMIVNRIRWYTAVETRGDDFKVNNNFIALYARLLVWQDPSFDGFFQLRECKPDRKLKTEAA
jgi:hypothetical protein